MNPPNPPAGSEPTPTVHVALATYQGRKWIEEQVRSVLTQEGVNVTLTVSDDGSTDGTREWISNLAKKDARVTLLPPRKGPRGVGPNFLHALVHLDVAPGQYAAFCDQDDVWIATKLADQIHFLRQTGSDAVSSNVAAFSETEGEGQTRVIKKDYPQVEWDFVFEAPSAGSTFLLTHRAWSVVDEYIRSWGVRGVALHDWFVYAVVRAAGLKWSIDPRPLVAYRQHERNALGVNRGVSALATRFGKLRSGHYREQFALTAQVARQVGQDAGRDPAWLSDLGKLQKVLADKSLVGRMGIAFRARQIRRRPLDQLSLAAACVLGVW